MISAGTVMWTAAAIGRAAVAGAKKVDVGAWIVMRRDALRLRP